MTAADIRLADLVGADLDDDTSTLTMPAPRFVVVDCLDCGAGTHCCVGCGGPIGHGAVRCASLECRSTPAVVVQPAGAGLMLSGQQEEGRRKILEWYQDPSRQVFRLFGFAGTGKTSTARAIVDSLGVEPFFAAFTGKAAYVLQTKGCDARTIHSLIYQPKEKLRKHLEELQKQFDACEDADEREALRAQIKHEEQRLDTPDFVLREDSPLSSAPLLVLDEVSMVGERIAYDLLGFGVKILCLGDPAQLPPVEGNGWFINAAPDHLLTEVHRSALDSPVTRIATAVRTATPQDFGRGVMGMDGDCGRVDHITRELLLEADQVLVGTNKTRWQVIHTIRQLRGLRGAAPVAGDRIIVLANSTEAGVFNGQQFDVLSVDDHTLDAERLRLWVRGDDGEERTLHVWMAGFQDMDGEKLAKRNGRGNVVAATFGQAITTHKAQGSQYRFVIVVDESGVFARGEQKDATAKGLSPLQVQSAAHMGGQRWLYTAVTRAEERVVVLNTAGGLPR